MMHKTINLSRARAKSAQKRAKKAVSILKEEFSEDVKVSRELNEEIWSRGAKKPPRKVTVEERDGVLYPAEAPKSSNSTDNSNEKKSEDDLSELVDGTIDEVKERVEDLEDPDFEALIEEEESGKDRKSLKEWFESQK